MAVSSVLERLAFPGALSLRLCFLEEERAEKAIDCKGTFNILGKKLKSGH